MAEIDHETAQDVLDQAFNGVEEALHRGVQFMLEGELQPHLQALFTSNTQAYREVLLGCLLARLQDKTIDIRLPYVNQGAAAYNARDLDEVVVNPFLKTKQIPSSKGPFLNVFRRGVKFEPATRGGLRDKRGYDSFLVLVNRVAQISDDAYLNAMLKAVLARFLELREQSHIAVARVHKLSLPQISSLMNGVLRIQSGGRFPVFLVVATFRSLNEAFNLGWTIDYQGINVADAASGEAGDITVRRGNAIVIAAEVTERVVERSRVVSTFTTKIAPLGIQDYLFFVKEAAPDAYTQAHQYFSQGHDVNFLSIKLWILDILATVGVQGRAHFVRHLVDMLSEPDVPRQMKVGWNDLILQLTSS
ncbi:MAG: restriction endonuclease, SacI family [Acidobacteriia bacterium]|nr:restriction endonuclease, SacI family [Terriglobia bacterium]